MRAFVTGGAGFLGTRVVKRLLDEGWTVRCLVRSRAAAAALRDALPAAGERLEFAYGALQENPGLRASIDGADAVFHLAAAVKGGPATLFLDTVVGTRALVAAVEDLPIGRFVLVSSLAVYGTFEIGRGTEIDERCPLDPQPHLRDPYSFSKIVQEQVCWEAFARHALPLVVIRPGVIYGPGRPNLLGRVGLVAGNVVLRFAGRHRLPCTFVDNCADAIVLAGSAAVPNGRAYNIVDDGTPTAGQVLRLQKAAGARLRVLRIPSRLLPLVAAMYECYWERSGRLLPPVLTRYRAAFWKPLAYSHRAATDELGWRPRVATDAGLELTFGAGPARG